MSTGQDTGLGVFSQSRVVVWPSERKIIAPSSPAAPPMTEEEMREEMLRHRAEQIVRDGVGKTSGFEREVARVVKELKALERDAGRRVGKG